MFGFFHYNLRLNSRYCDKISYSISDKINMKYYFIFGKCYIAFVLLVLTVWGRNTPSCQIVKGGDLSPVRHKAADPYGANP